jgi:hypothetical protein
VAGVRNVDGKESPVCRIGLANSFVLVLLLSKCRCLSEKSDRVLVDAAMVGSNVVPRLRCPWRSDTGCTRALERAAQPADSLTVATVPLPPAVLLFGTALIWVSIRIRRPKR